MRLNPLPWLAAMVLAGSCRPPSSPPPATDTPPPAIIGTWRVVRFCDDDDVTGRLYEPWGPAPTGFFIYTADGHLSVQIERTPPVTSFAAGDLAPTPNEARALLDGYLGYYGSYRVTSDSTVIHHVDGGTQPSFVGTDQPRLYRIRGDSLTLGGSRRTWECRLLVRVPAEPDPSPPR